MEWDNFTDYEGSRLIRLINNKIEYYAKLDPATMQAKHLLSEIEFLKNDILPLIANKNLYLMEINKFINKQMMNMAEKRRKGLGLDYTGILFYYHLKDREPVLIKADGKHIKNDRYAAPVAYISNVDEQHKPWICDIFMDIHHNPTNDILMQMGRDEQYWATMPEFINLIPENQYVQLIPADEKPM